MIFSKCDRHLKSHDFDFALTDADLAHSLPTSLADGQSYYVHTCEVRGHTVARTCLFLGGLWVAFAPAPSQEKSAWTLQALASSGPVGGARLGGAPLLSCHVGEASCVSWSFASCKHPPARTEG